MRPGGFSPRELAEIIRRRYPAFEMRYQPDFRQVIADAWPRSIGDAKARAEWSLTPAYSLAEMVEDMLTYLASSQPTAQGKAA